MSCLGLSNGTINHNKESHISKRLRCGPKKPTPILIYKHFMAFYGIFNSSYIKCYKMFLSTPCLWSDFQYLFPPKIKILLIVYMFVFGNACLKRHIHHVPLHTNKIKFKLPYFPFFIGGKIFIYFSCKENNSNSNTSFILNISYINYMAVDTKIGTGIICWIICLHSYIYIKENKHFNIQ